MPTRSLLVAVCLVCLPAVAAAQSKQAAREQQFKDEAHPLIKKYCFECHGAGSSEGDFNLDKYTSAQKMLEGRKTWLKVLRRMESASMPPKDHDTHPTKEEYAKLAKFIDVTLHDIDCSGPPIAGHVTLRRLTRYEYRNTIKDLIGVDYEPAKSFPADEVGYGFDNIGDVLSLPPLLLEKYLIAAEDITKKVIVTEAPDPKTIAEVRAARMEGAGNRDGRNDRMLTSSGETTTELDIANEGEFTVRVTASADQAGDELAKLALRIDGKEVRVFELAKHRVREKLEQPFKFTKGKHKFGLEFVNDYYDEKQPEGRRDRNVLLSRLEIFGPIGTARDNYPETHKKLIIAVPDEKTSWAQAARTNLYPFASRAFRRPATDAELTRLEQVVEIAKANGDNFETGMQLGVQAVLASPHFLFKVESNPDPKAGPEASYQLNDWELATRLSYFLWSTMPDDELFRLARENKLHEPAVLEQQTRRMLKDPRSQALVENFATQWLTLRNLETVQPNGRQFRQWNQPLREAMKKETELFIGEVMREDMSLLRLLDADFTFVNQPLAALYGLEGVKGDEFRKVSLAGTKRGGILTQASILTVTSNPGRTSPVKRGKWIMENLLNDAPPPPPPNVPEIKEERSFELSATLREKMKKHREDPVCNSCHQVMDSLGFALENYDAIGSYREKEGRFEIDASGELPTGEKFAGAAELRQMLLTNKRKEFVACATEKMLTYALGRGLEYYDQCVVDSISASLDKNDHRFGTLAVEIVRSYPFQHQGVKRSE